MTPMQPAADLTSPLLARCGSADALSLALMDARTRTLTWLGVFESAQAADVRTALHLTQQALGCGALIDVGVARARLAETVEAALDAIAAVGDGDDVGLHPWRAALHREDRLVERFAALAQARGLQAAAALVAPQTVLAARAPLWFPAQRVAAAMAGEWRPDNEAGDADDEDLPEFAIDAQAVSWQQFVEFMADGGYDEPRWWSDAGRAWLQGAPGPTGTSSAPRGGASEVAKPHSPAAARRAPRDVEQWRHGVLVQSFGRPVRVSAQAPACGVTRHEAEAWCRWAGRRLPAGVEWQLAARIGISRGYVGHQVSEWVLGRAADGSGRAVQRGVPWLAPRRLAHPAVRRAVDADRDDGFFGFRSCAL